MRKLVIGLILIAVVSTGTSFEAELVTSNESDGSTDLFFDKTSNYSDFYSGFPDDFNEPESIGSFSFTDNSLLNRNVYLKLEQIDQNLTGEKLQLYYSSRDGENTEPVLSNPVYIGNYSDSNLTVDIDISAFEALFPGKVYAGFPEREVESSVSGATFESTSGENNFTHTFSAPVDSSTGGSSLNGLTVSFDSEKVGNVGQEDMVSVEIENESGSTDVLDDLSSVSTGNSGSTLTLGFSGNYNLEEGEEVIVIYEDAEDSDVNEVQEVDVNPESTGSEYTDISEAGATESVTEGPFELTEAKSSIMDGNYTVLPSIRSVAGKTEITVTSAYDSSGEEIHANRDLSTSLIMSVERNGEILDSQKTVFQDSAELNFSFIGGEKVYVNGILSLETRSVSGCETINERDYYYLLNESTFNSDSGQDESCLEVTDVNDTIVDFANNTIDGNGNSSMQNSSCAVSIRDTSGITLKNPRVQQFDRGICVTNSQETLITGTSSRENNLGIYMNNSSADIQGISLKNEKAEIDAVENSTANMSEIDFETADITAIGNDVRLKNVFNPPPDPNGSLNMSQWINITKNDNSSSIENLGFNYPPLSESDINPLYMYKFDLLSSVNGSREWTYENLSIVKRPNERILMNPEEINEFSVFGIYGERIEGNGTGNDPGEGAGDNENGTGSQGGTQDPGSGQSTGGAGDGLQPEPEPEPTPIQLNLSLEDESIRVQQGGTGTVNFSVENIGEVDSPNVYVESETRLGWQSGRQDFDGIPQGDSVEGGILLDVYEDEVTGNYSVPVEVKSQPGSTLDTAYLNVEVLPRREMYDISIVEGPTFLNLESRSSEQLGFLLENTGDYDLENVSLDVRNADDCIQDAEGSHDFIVSERKNVEYSVETVGQEGTCTGVFVFSSDDSSELGFTPVRISIAEPSLVERLTTSVLPIILLVWTLFTAYWVRRRFYER